MKGNIRVRVELVMMVLEESELLKQKNTVSGTQGGKTRGTNWDEEKGKERTDRVRRITRIRTLGIQDNGKSGEIGVRVGGGEGD